VKNQLEAIGIHTNLSSMDYASWMEQLMAGKIDLFLNGINAQTGEPDRCMYLRWHSSCIPGGTNMTQFSNPEFDQLLTTARTPMMKPRSWNAMLRLRGFGLNKYHLYLISQETYVCSDKQSRRYAFLR
jgi:ABC-type transport system substrate-binding protein